MMGRKSLITFFFISVILWNTIYFSSFPEVVLLSFDVEPVDGTESILKILDVLDESGVKATFFFTGEYVETYPGIVNLTYSRGHEIGCHGYSHRSLPYLSPEEKIFEVMGCRSSITALTGEAPAGFRAPYNRADEEIKDYLW